MQIERFTHIAIGDIWKYFFILNNKSEEHLVNKQRPGMFDVIEAVPKWNGVADVRLVQDVEQGFAGSAPVTSPLFNL